MRDLSLSYTIGMHVHMQGSPILGSHTLMSSQTNMYRGLQKVIPPLIVFKPSLEIFLKFFMFKF